MEHTSMKKNEPVKCQECNMAQAVYHLKQNIDGVTSQLHLCEACALKRGFDIDKQTAPLAGFLSAFAASGAQPSRSSDKPEPCPGCGLTYPEFRVSGLLGCDACYSHFKRQLLPMLRRIHGSNHHVGKSPGAEHKPKSHATDTGSLKKRLETAIKNEDYELAARLRDEIRDSSQASS